jgi:hypothetical protein
MLQAQYHIRENGRLYALIARDPWILNMPPVPPGTGPLGASDPDGDPVLPR